MKPCATACPRCDYSLLGLPAIGVCPECGRTYDAQSVYLYGYAVGQRANAWSRRPMRAREQVSSAVVALGILGFFMVRRHHDMFFMLYVICMIGGPILIALLRSHSDLGSGVVQVKLTP